LLSAIPDDWTPIAIVSRRRHDARHLQAADAAEAEALGTRASLPGDGRPKLSWKISF